MTVFIERLLSIFIKLNNIQYIYKNQSFREQSIKK
jgi:hypothetical protein